MIRKWLVISSIRLTWLVFSFQMDGAALISINTISEHNFVSQWLMSNDPAV